MSSVAVSVASLGGNGFLPRRRTVGARGPARGCAAPAMLTCRRAGIASGAIGWIRPRGVTRGETFGRVARVLVRASGTPEPQDRALRKTAGVNGDDPITGSLHQARGLRERLASVVDAFRPKPGASQTDDEPDEEWERWQRRFDRVDSEEGILVALQVSHARPRDATEKKKRRFHPPPRQPANESAPILASTETADRRSPNKPQPLPTRDRPSSRTQSPRRTSPPPRP